MKSRAPKLRDVFPRADREVARIVDRALAYEHDARWPDATAMQAAVRAVRKRLPDPVFIKTPVFDPEVTTRNDPEVYATTDHAVATAGKVSPSSEVTAVRPGSVDPLGPTAVGVMLRRTTTASIPDASVPAPDTDEMDKFPRSSSQNGDAAESVDAFMRRGCARVASGDLSGAEDDFTSALGLDPGCAMAYYDRAVLRQRRGEYSGSLSDYGDVIALLPDFAEAHFNRALCLEKTGDLSGARTEALAAGSLYETEGRNVEAEAARLLARTLWASDSLQK
jgi:tetratricopeptide (TPR) repeat protein